MFHALSVAIAILALLASPAAARGAPAEQSSEAAQSESDLLFNAFHEKLYAREYAAALATASKIELEPGNKQGSAIVIAMRAAAMIGLKRDKEAAALFAKADALDPTEPYISSIQFDAAMYADNGGMAAPALDRLISRFPGVVRNLRWEFVRYFLQIEPKGQDRQNQDRRVALARLGYGGEAEHGDWLAFGAVEILVKRGDVAGASELLPYIDEPQAVENLLIQRRYSALWQQIETLAGPHLEKVRASLVTAAERAYAEKPDSAERLQLLANAFRHAGRLDDAIALRSKLPATRDAMALADEQLGWAVNNVALALHEAGRADEADQLFALLNDAPMKEENWRVSMKINRLELLVADGKFDRALPLIEPTARVPGSPYAQQLVRRLRYCTLSGLARKEQAAKLLPELLKNAENAPGPTIGGLLCAGQIDEAEKLALESLKKDSFHESFVRQLQSNQLTSDDPSVWSKGWKELRRRPTIAAEFERLGRDMPASLLPPADAQSRLARSTN